MGMLLLNGSSEFGVRRELFANGEQGLWLDPSDMTAGKAGWRRNLLTYSAATAGAVTGTPGTGPTGWTASGSDGSLTVESNGLRLTIASGRRSFFQAVTLEAGRTYCFSAICDIYTTEPIHQIFEMSLLPAGATVTKYQDNVLLTEFQAPSVALNTELKLVVQVGGTGGAARVNFGAGINAIGTDSDITFKRFQFELGSTRSEYQPITDFSTEFKQAFPTHTLYQDSNGVTPCTAAGDPVGLILDQSRGGLANLGSEIVTNGGLSDATGWTVSGASPPSITGGQAVWSASTGEIQWASSLTVGKWYKLEFDLVSYTSGNLAFRDGTTNTSIATAGAVAGRKTFLINATSTQIRFISFASATVTIDNISVREVPGNHAYQTTSASRPTLARIPVSGRRNLLTYSEQLTNTAEAGLTRPWAVSAGANTVTPNYAQAPDGTNTANRLVFTSSSYPGRQQQIPVSLVAGQSYTFSIWIKRISGSNSGRLEISGGGGTVIAGFQTITGTADWQRVSLTLTAVGSGTASVYVYPEYAVSATGEYLLWGAQLETGSTVSNYQKVVATTDVTESGVGDLWHLVFDGSDDSLVTNSVDFNTWTQETRRNLLVDTESFAAATWTKTAVTANDNATTDPNGGNTACRLVETTATSEHRLDLTTGLSFTSGLTYTVSIYAKAAERTRIRFGFSELFQMPGRAYFDLSNGTTDNAIAGTTAAIENAGNGWYRCSVTCTCTGNVTSKIEVNLVSTGTTVNYTGDTANGVLIWGAQLETGSLTAYQRVGTDEMTVIAGVRKLSDAASAAFVEASADAGSNSGAFAVYAPRIANAAVEYRSRGTLTVTSNEGIASAAPTTLVFTGQSDISGDSLTVRKNGVQANSSAGDQGTGNYGNHILYIGRRGSSSLPYNGHLYQLIIRGKTTPVGKLLEAERFVAKRTGVTGI